MAMNIGLILVIATVVMGVILLLAVIANRSIRAIEFSTSNGE